MRRVACLCLTSVLAACAPAEGIDDELVAVEEGKADDYYSNVADEFEVTGSIGVELDHETFTDETLRKDAVDRRLAAVSLYLTAYLAQKLFGVDLDGDGQIGPDERVLSDEENLRYGGFQAMVRNETIAQRTLTGTPPKDGETATMRASFRVVVAGPRDLPQRLPKLAGASQASRRFALVLPAGASFDPADVDGEEVRRFDPEKAKAAGVALETLTLSIARIPEKSDAFPRYDAFVADGLYDLALVYGFDPNPKRFDLVEAKKGYDGLLRLGFQPPAGVARFEDLRADSGPFRRTMRAGKKDVAVEARLLHANMWDGPAEGRTARREAQRAQILAELERSDVFFYNGHAGPYEGMTLDPDGVAFVSANDLSSIDLDAAHPQLFVAQGCQSAAQYADALYANEAKDAANLDVITTVNYAYGEGTMGLVGDLLATDGERHRPRSFYALIAALNADPINAAREVFYGVVGLGDNPKLHPYADVAGIGKRCSVSADCGDPDGNWCIRQAGVKSCAAITLGRGACPAGTKYRSIAQGRSIIGAVCAK